MQTGSAIGMMVIAMAFFAANDAFVKLAAKTLDAGQIMLLSGLGALAVFLVMLRRDNTPFFSKIALYPAVVLRTLGETMGALGIVTALALLPLATVSTVTQAQPLLMTMAGALILKEAVGWHRWMAVAIGFVGVIIVLQPGTVSFDPATLWLVLALVGLTLRDVYTRLLPDEVTTAFVSAWVSLSIAVFGGVVMLVTGGWQPVSPIAWFWILMISLTVALAFIFVTAALRVGEMSAVAPFRYSRVLFAFTIAIIFFQERPTWTTWLGMVLIVGSGLYAFWRERRKKSAARPKA